MERLGIQQIKKYGLGILIVAFIGGGAALLGALQKQSKLEAELLKTWQLSSPREYESLLARMTVRVPLTPENPEFTAQVSKLMPLYNQRHHTKISSQQDFLEAIGCYDGVGLTLVDIDHNGQQDFIFTYSGSGSGGYAGIGAMLTLNQEGQLSEVLLNENLLMENMASSQVSIRTLSGMNYIYFRDGSNLDRYFLIQGDVTQEVFNDMTLVQNDHLNTPEAEAEKEHIYDLFDIGNRAKALKNQGIDFSVTGRSAEDLLIQLYQLKEYMSKDQKAAVARMIQYPLFYKEASGKMTKLYSPEAFVQHYEAIVTPSLKQAVVEADETKLFANYRGVMIGEGAVWISDTVFIQTQ